MARARPKKKSAIKPRNAVTRDSVNSTVTATNTETSMQWVAFAVIDQLQKQIDLLQSELAILEREYRRMYWGEG